MSEPNDLARRAWIAGEIVHAVDVGDEQAVREFIASGADLNAHPGDGYTPVKVAARSDRLRILTLLLDAGADPNGGPECGSALMEAAAAGEVDVVRALLGAGADPDLRDGDGDTVDDWIERRLFLGCENREALEDAGRLIRAARAARP